MQGPDPQAQQDPLTRLERQVERGAFFTHAGIDRLAVRLRESEQFVMGLTELLLAKGLLQPEEVSAVLPDDAGDDSPGSGPVDKAALAAAAYQAGEAWASPEGDRAGIEAPPAHDAVPEGASEQAGEPGEVPFEPGEVPFEPGEVPFEPGEVPGEPGNPGDPAMGSPYHWPSVAVGLVQPMETPVAVNCAERMHVCHAVCCKMNFALTAPEIDAGKVKWDLGFPFMIRHEEDGYCTHLERGSGGCGVYADRPGVCGRYSCAEDPRIWKDFDKMELNEEFLAEHVSGTQRIRVRPNLPLMEPVTQPVRRPQPAQPAPPGHES